MILDVRTIRKVRTEEEKRRRHLFGDAGAKFSQRKLELGGGYNELPDNIRGKG